MSPAALIKKIANHSGLIMMSRLAGAGIGFLTQFLLVRLMGAHDLGLFYAASSLAAVLGVIAAQGYPQIAARFVGRYRNKKADGLFGAFTAHAMRDGLTFAGLAALTVIAWAFIWPGLPHDERITYAMAASMILVIVTLNILTNVAGGMRLFMLCYMPEGFLRPLVFFAAVGLAGLSGIMLSASRAMLIFAVLSALIACGVAVILGRQMPQDMTPPALRPRLAQRWRIEAWQLVLLAVFTNFFADVGIVIAAMFLDNANTAVFGLCLKLALLVGYFVQIGQQMVVPDMADARHTGDDNRLRRAARRSILLPSAITLMSMAAVWLHGAELLSLFGPDFAAGRDALLVLLAAQLLRALAGPSAHLLTLSGIQSVNMGIAVSSLAVLCGSTAILANALGVTGAAFAVLLTYGYWIAVSAIALRRIGEPSVDIVSLSLA